jgi:CubicO group peptidase (beta-lactamase class C family)
LAHPDSTFEIGSITKTFTGLVLAQMVAQNKVALTEPVRSLLPARFAGEPSGTEITLLDLATQVSEGFTVFGLSGRIELKGST